MVLPLALAGASLAPFALNVLSKTSKYYSKFAGQPLGQAAQFGLGYGASTAVGYNLVPQFGKKKFINSNTFSLNSMPYGRRYSSRYRRPSYPSRYGRRYGSRYARRGRTSYRRSYYGRRYY